MPSGYAWEQKALCVLAEAYLCLFSFWLTVPASIHAVNVFSLEKHNRAAWIHLRSFQKPNSNLMMQKLWNLCCLSPGNSQLCGQWPFHSECMLPLIYLWAWVVYFSVSVLFFTFFPPFFFTTSCFVCLFCILKPFRGFFLPFRNIFQLKWWNYSKLRLYHISACIFAKTLSEDFLLRPCVFILPLLIPHTNVPLH